MWRSGCLVVLGLWVIMGCAPPLSDAVAVDPTSGIAGTPVSTVRIIAKFARTQAVPPSERFVQELSKDAGARLIFLRSTAGDALVFSVEGVSSGEQLQDVMQRLAARPDVVYVEQDRILRHQR
ncbi:MAG: hypothetical protein ACE5LB_03710 [Acidiferrobacterales bacterium]